MTELMTLKDLIYEIIEQVNVEDLKQEAIKWIKEAESHTTHKAIELMRLQENALTEEISWSKFKNSEDIFMSGKILWIIHFFNIIEDDLN